MSKWIAALLLLMGGAVLAQHDHAAMSAEDHAAMHAIPPGNGPAADGGAWLRPDKTGIYYVHPLPAKFRFNPVLLEEGRVYRIWPHTGVAVWRSAERDEPWTPIPAANLIAPTTVAPAKATRAASPTAPRR